MPVVLKPHHVVVKNLIFLWHPEVITKDVLLHLNSLETNTIVPLLFLVKWLMNLSVCGLLMVKESVLGFKLISKDKFKSLQSNGEIELTLEKELNQWKLVTLMEVKKNYNSVIPLEKFNLKLTPLSQLLSNLLFQQFIVQLIMVVLSIFSVFLVLNKKVNMKIIKSIKSN